MAKSIVGRILRTEIVRIIHKDTESEEKQKYNISLATFVHYVMFVNNLRTEKMPT